MKTCPKCNGNGPFNNCKGRKDGLQVYCISCLRLYYKQNRERIRESTKNRDKTKKAESDHKYHEKNKSRLNEKAREYYSKNRTRMRKHQKANAKYNEWSAARKAKEFNAKGRFTQQEWEDLKKHYFFTCLACRRTEPEIELTVDHVKPLSSGGSNFIKNIQPLCRGCNTKKQFGSIDLR